MKVRNDFDQTLATYTYGYSNRRLVEQHGGESSSDRTYYAWGDEGVVAEYSENASRPTSPAWDRAYVYLGSTLIATHVPGAQGDLVEFYHPDRVGVRLVTGAAAGADAERVTLPYGTPLAAESAGVVNGAPRRNFTTYERSDDTALDYATNRFYDWHHGRFTQADPSGFEVSSMSDPQSFNLYAYCGNDPVNATDPSGLDGFSISIFGIPFPGGGGGARSGWPWLGGLAGLLSFGLGVAGYLAWLFQRPSFRQPFVTNSLTSHLTPPRTGTPDPHQPPLRHVSLTLYSTSYEPQRYESQDEFEKSPEYTKLLASYVAKLMEKFHGISVVWSRDGKIERIEFPGSYEEAVKKLTELGYYSGVYSYNPLHHSGGKEFRDPLSSGCELSFHFKVLYPKYELEFETNNPRRDFPRRRRLPGPTWATDVHIDRASPLYKGLLKEHAKDFLKSLWQKFGPN